MNWKKRTQAEVDYSADKLKDFTGGYEWWPWLWYMRKGYLLGFFGNLALGWAGGLSAASDDPRDWISYAVIGFFGIFAPSIIGFMLRRDYKEGKQGKTR
jgi:hypothetical protein